MKTFRPDFALAVLLATTASAATLDEREISLAISPDDAAEAASLAGGVALSPGPHGSRYLDATITNRAAHDVALAGATLRFPWEPELSAAAGDRLATGGSCMFRTPTFVHAEFAKLPASGAFLLTNRAGAAPAARHAFVGFLTWRTAWSRLAWQEGRAIVRIDGEGRLLRPGETLQLERLWLAAGGDWQDLLWGYADEIVRENKIRQRAWPRYVGWSTWDYYGSKFTYDQIVGNMKALLAMNVGANLIQIDGGWWAKKGDYLTSRADLPGGMKGLAAQFRAAGLSAGLHLDAMRADRNADVAREHPDYFLHDQHGAFLASNSPTQRDRIYFDFSHPGAREFMRTALRTMRRDWGYDYFKLDFLKFGFPEMILQECGLDPKSTRIVPHDPALTSVERFHLAMRAFREGMGEDAFLLACSAEFGPTFGHADAQRTSGDIDPQMHRFSRAPLEHGGNFYLHPKVLLADTDYHVVRAKEDEDATRTKDPRKTGGDMTADEAQLWTHYAGLFSWPKISGDNLMILRDERKAFFRQAVELPRCDRFVPIDFWQHARHRDDPFTTFLGEADGRPWLVVFNWAAEPREIVVEGFADSDLRDGRKFSGSATTTVDGRSLRIALPPHASVAYELGGAAQFDTLRRALQVAPPKAGAKP